MTYSNILQIDTELKDDFSDFLEQYRISDLKQALQIYNPFRAVE